MRFQRDFSFLICRGPELELVPEGYLRLADGWHCAPGFAGVAKASSDVLDCFMEGFRSRFSSGSTSSVLSVLTTRSAKKA